CYPPNNLAVEGDNRHWTITIDFPPEAFLAWSNPQAAIGADAVVDVRWSRSAARSAMRVNTMRIDRFVDVEATSHVTIADRGSGPHREAAAIVYPLWEELAVPSRVREKLRSLNVPDQTLAAVHELLDAVSGPSVLNALSWRTVASPERRP